MNPMTLVRYRSSVLLMPVLLLAAAVAGTLSAQGQTVELYSTAVESASGTGGTPGYPFNTFYNDQRMESLYPASELTAAGLYPGAKITEMHLKIADTPGRVVTNFRIRLGEISAATTSISSFTDMQSGLLGLVAGPVSFTPAQCPAGQWVAVPLDLPYTWGGACGLRLDFSSDGDSYAWGGAIYLRASASTQSYKGFGDSGQFPFDGQMFTNRGPAPVVPSLRMKIVPGTMIAAEPSFAGVSSYGFTPAGNSRRECLILASELTASFCYPGAVISQIQIRSVGSNYGAATPSLRIRMGHTSASSYALGSSFTSASSGVLTTVYGPTTFGYLDAPAGRWLTLNLSPAFIWNGGQNVIVDVTSEGANAEGIGFRYTYASGTTGTQSLSAAHGAVGGAWPFDGTAAGNIIRESSAINLKLLIAPPSSTTIAVERESRAIADGGADNFPTSLTANAVAPVAYTLKNNGGIGALTVSQVSITGQTNCAAVLGGGTLSNIATGGGSGSVLINCTPQAGAWSFTVTLANNAVLVSAQSYSWTVSGLASATSVITELYPYAAQTSPTGAAALGYPLNKTYQDQRMECIYEATELLARGCYAGAAISEVQLYVSQAPAVNVENFRIRMGHTSASTITLGGFTPQSAAVLSAAYGPVTLTPAQLTTGQWATFTLTTPFAWNGTSNVKIDFTTDGTLASSTGGIQLRATPGAQGLRGYGNTATWPFDTGMTGTFVESAVPAMRITFPIEQSAPAFKAQDVNHSSAVNVQDVQLTVNIILAVATPAFTGQGDVNNSGTVTVADVQSIVNCILNAATCP
jgi:hypothetical protein